MNDAVQTEQQLADLAAAQSSSALAVVIDTDWPGKRVTVRFADGVEQTMGWALSAPWEGDTVRVLRVDGQPFCLAVMPPEIGTVQAIGGNLATVVLDDDTRVQWPFLGTAPANGARVNVSAAGRVILGTYSTEPPGSEFEPPPKPPAPTRRTVRFIPVGTANYRGGAYQGQELEISSSGTPRSAFVFYGTQVRDTIPPGATGIEAELVLAENWDNVPGTPSKLGTHGHAGGVPGSSPGIDASGALDVYDGGSINVASLIPRFRSGAAFGFAFPGGYGWRQFAASADLWVSFYP